MCYFRYVADAEFIANHNVVYKTIYLSISGFVFTLKYFLVWTLGKFYDENKNNNNLSKGKRKSVYKKRETIYFKMI